MNHELIASWLDVSAEHWPPDHYSLLGLTPGETDLTLIEQHAQERLELVRQYQLTEADSATEAMNQLAQAFVCLSDPRARKVYDHKLLGTSLEEEEEKPTVEQEEVVEPPLPSEQPSDEIVAAANEEALAVAEKPEVWLQQTLKALESGELTPINPAPAPHIAVEIPKLDDLPEESETVEVKPTPSALNEQRSAEVPEDHIVKASRTRRGLTTKRAYYVRLAKTRSILRLWHRVGKYLNKKGKVVKGPAEAKELINAMTALHQTVEDLDLPLGQTGEPGCHVLTLARQPRIVPTLSVLDSSQRETLTRDWESGRRLLEAHKKFLREESQQLQSRFCLGTAYRYTRNFLKVYPSAWAGILGILALLILLVRQIF